MAKQTINIGTTANDRTGDPLRTAFTKINQNFTELYNADAAEFSGNYNDLTNKPNLNLYQLASTAFSGDYDDLDNKPTIPADISDLTDTEDLIPADVSDLTDTSNIIERKYSIIKQNYAVKDKAASAIEIGELIPQDLSENYISSTEDTRVLNFSTESEDGASFSTLFESAVFNKQAFELFITDHQGNDDVFFTKTVSYIPTDTNSYRGFNASFSTIHDTGRPSINQIVITTEDVSPSTSVTQTADDDFTVSSIGGSGTVAVISIFRGSEDPVGRGQLWEFFKEYVDLVLYTEDTQNNTETIKSRFYQHIESLKAKVPVLYPDFQFYSNTAVTANSSIVTGGSGSGAAFSLLSGRYEGETWRNGSLLNGGSGYTVGNTLTILGTNLGGTSNNNVSILISGADENGLITAYTVSGTAVNIWPTSEIEDGGSGQYDASGNIINTNISTDVDYNDGNRVPSSGTASTPFGSASSYVTLYKDSIFSMVAKDSDITSVYFSGTLGSEEDIEKNHGELEGVIGYKVEVGGLSVTGNWVEDRVYTVSYSYAGYDFPRTLAGSIKNTDITNWNTAYSWGNHLLGGYYRNPADLVDLENLIPADDAVYDLGSPERQWRSLHVSANTIFVGGTPISVSGGDLLVDGLPVAGGRIKSTASNDRRIEEVSGSKSVTVSEIVTNNITTFASRSVVDDNRFWVYSSNTIIDDILDNPSAYDVNDTSTIEFSLDNNIWYQYIGGYTGDLDEIGVFANGTHTYNEGDTLYFRYKSGGAPVVWWDKQDLPGGYANFRGAVIDYHAYTGQGTWIGTIHIVDDSSEEHITHTEVSSGSTDMENDDLWLVQNEGTISYRRIDGETTTLKIHWTAKVFYGSEFYDD